jgi:hypothetical protein
VRIPAANCCIAIGLVPRAPKIKGFNSNGRSVDFGPWLAGSGSGVTKEHTMACQICQIEIPETLCQVCRAIEAQTPATCKECGAPLDDPQWMGRFCHVCNSMYEVIRASRWLSMAQTEWIHENFALARRKRVLLGQTAPGLPAGPTEGSEQS